MSRKISFDWVLNQLAGMSFPEQGGAHAYMQKCFESQKEEYYVQRALERLTCKQAVEIFRMWRDEDPDSKEGQQCCAIANTLVCFEDQKVPQLLLDLYRMEEGIAKFFKMGGSF
jgi:hypothetical protein